MFAKLKNIFIIIIKTGQRGSKHHPVKFQATLAVLGAAQRLSQWSVLMKSNKRGNHSTRGKKREKKKGKRERKKGKTREREKKSLGGFMSYQVIYPRTLRKSSPGMSI